MVKNLTEGRPLNLLFFFALPMVAGNLFQQLYNMVDTEVYPMSRTILNFRG